MTFPLACLILLSPQLPPGLPTKAQVQTRYDVLAKAFAQGDESILGNLFTADFAGESPDGHRMGRRGALATFGGLMASGDARSWPRKVLRLRVDHGDDLVTVQGRYKSVWTSPSGKRTSHGFDITTEDRWRRTRSGWRLSGWKYLHFAEFDNGKDITLGRWQAKHPR